MLSVIHSPGAFNMNFNQINNQTENLQLGEIQGTVCAIHYINSSEACSLVNGLAEK